MSKLLISLGQNFRPLSHARPNIICDIPHVVIIVPSRHKYWHNRHRDDRFRRERKWKTWPVELPDFDHYRKTKDENLSPDEIQSKMKEKGIAPPTNWNEREIFQPCTMAIIEPYNPPSDGKSSSLLSKLKSPVTGGTDLVKHRRALGTIRAYEGEEFNFADFSKKAKELYIKAHELLVSEDSVKIFDYVTEHCWPMMTAGLNKHTVVWKYLGDIEEPTVVQARTGELASKSNIYSQITVRFYSKQIMAVYDRHGRLMLGSPTDVKEVLEYIVFEKYLANEYGLWRMHDRIRFSDGTAQTMPIQTRIKL